MKRSGTIQPVLMFAAIVAFACLPQAAYAQRGGGGHGGGVGGFHGGSGANFHGGGASHGGGHSSYSAGRAYGGSRGGYYGRGAYYGRGWYGGYRGWYGGRYWGYPGYGWGWGWAYGYGWPYWGWGYPYAYGYYPWGYAPYSYSYSSPNSDPNYDPINDPYTCPPGYQCIQDGNSGPPPGDPPAKPGPKPTSNVNPRPWRTPAPANGGNANLPDSTETNDIPRSRVLSVDRIVATPATYRTRPTASPLVGPMRPEVKRAMQMLEPASAKAPSASQRQQLDKDLTMLREDIRAKKKSLIAANLTLTPDQATKFWPVYDQYAADLAKINDAKYALIKEYADTWCTIADDQVVSLIKRAIDVDTQVTQLRPKYIPIFNKVVPGKITTTFFQIDRRVQAMIDLQLSAQLPLVQARN